MLVCISLCSLIIRKTRLRNLTSGIDLGKKKKRRRPKKKKHAAIALLKQSSPPRVQLSNLFPSGVYPEGEIAEHIHNENTFRTAGEEIRHLDHMDENYLNEYRQAAEVHRQVRQWTQQNVKPWQSLTEIAEGIEDGVRALTGHQGLVPGDSLKAGMGFPTGLSLNNCAAHFTPNPGKDVILQYDDVMKVDFGVHVNGRIVDSAFTMAFSPVYDSLLEAVRAATDTGVKVRVGFCPASGIGL
jgi:methionyl aminopeptidase